MGLKPADELITRAEPSRRRQRVGDVFAVHVVGKGHVFGRVVSTDAVVGPWKCILVYIYKGTGADLTPPADMHPSCLLIEPITIDSEAWRRGYCQTIGNIEIKDGDRLPVHCFEGLGGRHWFDEHGNSLSQRIEPCGTWSLTTGLGLIQRILGAIGVEHSLD